MRRLTNYKISKECFEDMLDARRFNPCLEITFRDKAGKHIHKLSTGDSDDIHVYREDGETFVLSQNPRLGYVGMEVFHDGEQIRDVFLEAHQITEVLGRDDLAPFTMIRRLNAYVVP